MDLRSIGGKCLPQPSLLAKASHLQGPIVLQVPRCCSYVDSGVIEVSDFVINAKSSLLIINSTDNIMAFDLITVFFLSNHSWISNIVRTHLH